MSQAPRKSTRATKGQPPEILDPATGLGLASSKDTRESNAAEPLAGEADVFTTPRKDAIPASTVLDGEPGNVLYYDIPKVNKNQGRERGARFDWACKLW